MDPHWAAQHGMMHPAHMHPGYHPRSMDGLSLPPGLPGLSSSSDPLEAVLGPFPCARLRGMPFDVTLEDVLVFFQGLVVLDVVMHNQGEAFVVFANPMDFQMALQRDRQTIGRRYVEVLQGKRSDYYAAIASKQMYQYPLQPPQVPRGQMVSGEEATGENLELGMDANTTWASTPGETVASQGAEGQHTTGVGEGNRTNRPPPQTAGRGGGGRGAGAPARRTGGGIQVGEHTGYLRMRGLPFSSTKEDIAIFFKEHKSIGDSIVLTYRSDGRATGEGYIAFETPDDAKEAMSLHRNTMGSRYIELFISNKEEHGRAMTRFGGR